MYIDKDGTLKIRQGDTGVFVVSGVPTDQNYKVCFAIHDYKYQITKPEIITDSQMSDIVEVKIPSSYTQDIPVELQSGKYFYAIKLVGESGNEITVIPAVTEGDVNIFEKAPSIIIYKEMVDGE